MNAMFRADPNRTGHYGVKGVPKVHRVRWRFQAGHNVLSSPVLGDGCAFFASRDGFLYAVDIQTGQPRWKFPLHRGSNASPAISDELVLIGSEVGRLFAVDVATGQMRWQAELGLPTASSAVVANGMAYVGSGGTRPMQAGGFIHALDVQNGQEAWRFGAERGFYSSPALHPSQALLICGNRDGHVYALNTATGELRWQYSTEHEIVSTPAISIEHNLVCVASDDAKLHVIHADSGKREWSFKTGRALLDSSPAIAHDRVFLAGKDGVFRTFDLLTGKLLWVIECAADGEPDTFASPSVAAGLVYAACSDGTVTAWDVVTGHEVWQLEMPVTTTTWTSSAVGNGMLCIGAGHDQSVFLVE